MTIIAILAVVAILGWLLLRKRSPKPKAFVLVLIKRRREPKQEK